MSAFPAFLDFRVVVGLIALRIMSYIPPFKRASSDKNKPSPKPESLDLELKNKTWPGTSRGRLLYADRSMFRWFPVGLTSEGQVPSYIKLEPVKQIPFENSFSLVNDRQTKVITGKDLSEERPWDLVAKNVLGDLLPAFESVKNSIGIDDLVKIKPKFVARLGKVHFRGIGQDISGKASVVESDMRNMKRIFHTDLSRSYNDHIARKFSSKSGFISQDKNSFLIRLSDNENPDNNISCKCWQIAGSGSLQLGKIYLNDIRQLVVDVSCLNEKLDLRLLLSMRRLTKLTDDEVEGIRGIISSAVIDPNVKGGLRWSFGKASFRNRFRVYCVWNVHAKSYASWSFRLKLRQVERFHFTTSVGESTEETSLTMKALVSELLGQNVEADEILKNLNANLKFMWENFFCPELFSI